MGKIRDFLQQQEEEKPKNIIRQTILEEMDDKQASNTYEGIKSNPLIVETAKRFASDKLGMKNVNDETAIDEFIEHFRSFNVNELTAAGDYGYVSAAASDAKEGRDKTAKQRLADYRLLYETYLNLPGLLEEGSAPGAFGDYFKGLATAPSTYVGLVLPGAGKAGGVAATQAAKAGVNNVLLRALTPRPYMQFAAKNPLTTTVLVEGAGGAAQDIAQQKTELEIDMRDDYNAKETALAFGISAALPAAEVLRQGKNLARSKIIERNTVDLVKASESATLKANEEAAEKAEKILVKNKKIATDAKEKLRALNPDTVADGKVVAERLRPDGLQEDLVISLDPAKTKRVFAAVTEIISADTRLLKDIDPEERITETIANVIKTKKDGDEFAEKIFKDLNITGDDFANLFMADLSEAARKLQQAGSTKKLFRSVTDVASTNIFSLDDATKESVKRVGKAIDELEVQKINKSADEVDTSKVRKALQETTGEAKPQGIIKRLDQARLAFMTSQTATTVRNVASGYTRVGFDVLTRALDLGMQRAYAKITNQKMGTTFKDDLGDVFTVVYGLGNKKETDAINEIFKNGFEDKATSMFRELRDIKDASGLKGRKLGSLEILSRELNAINTASDQMFKKVAFVSSLKRQLNNTYNKQIKAGKTVDKNDYDLLNIIKEGKFNSTFNTKEGKDALNKAVRNALEFTYQETPNGPVRRAIINGIHKAPFLTTSLIPFPRFILSAMRFTYQYNPAYLLHQPWVKFATGKAESEDFGELSKALVGTGLIYAASTFRMSESAGENWYEGRLPNGQSFDMRPFFPAAPFLFFGELVARYRQGKPMFEGFKALDAVQALSGTQFKAGLGLYALDGVARDLTEATDPTYTGGAFDSKKLDRILVEAAANIVNTYTIPFTASQDLFNTFLAPDEARIVKQTRTDDLASLFINKSLSRLPMNYELEEYVASKLGTRPSEMYETPFQEQPLRRVTPITRQTYGILLRERKNIFQKELERLKIPRSKIARKTGVPEADQLFNQLFGEHATDVIVPTLNSKSYTEANDEEKKKILIDSIDLFKGNIRENARAVSTLRGESRYGFDPFAKADFLGLNKNQKKFALDKYHRVMGKPKENEKYDFERLLTYGKQIK